MTDYGHHLLFGSFLTPTARTPERVVGLTVLSERLGLDLATSQDTVLPNPDEGRRRSDVWVWDEAARPSSPVPEPDDSYDARQLAALPFTCTAGLHRAVRHDDAATGFRHHGYLNMLLAADAAEQGATAADRSSDGVAAAVGALTPERLRAARVRFTSFGTCSIAEPVEDLVALGLLDAPAPVPEAAG